MTCIHTDDSEGIEVLTERIGKRAFIAYMKDFPFVTTVASTRKRAGDRLMDFYESAILHLN